jgi:hypothetical protein
MKPLCPLVHKRHRLEVSIVEARREGGKVRQKHIASLGSLAGDSLVAREAFWLECEARLQRLSNRLGPDLDRLHQAIAARIPPLTDADRAAMEAAAWNSMQSMWEDHAKSKAFHSFDWNETAKQCMREAIKAEANALQAKTLRGNPKAFDALNRLLGLTLGAAAMGRTANKATTGDSTRQEAETNAPIAEGRSKS